MSAYEQQLARVHRFFKRIETPLESQTEYDDMMWAFIQNCWHLKDWIINDDSAPKALRDRVMPGVRKSKCLQVCADLTNRSKHFKLEQKPWRDANMRADIRADIGGLRPGESQYRYYAVDDRGETYELLDLARSALEEWEGIISGKKGHN